jgi:hypothetical protein
MTFRAHLVHGIRDAGNSAVRGLIPYFAAQGATVFYPDYGFENAVETRHVNPFIVGSLLPYIQPGDIYVGHSNGCAIGFDLASQGAPFGGMVFINAALETDIVRPPQIPWIDVYFNSGDSATEAAVIARHLGIADPVWGEMGHAGYAGADARITNVDCGATAELPHVSGHSDIFEPAKITAWAPYIIERIMSRLPQALAA